MPERRLRSRSKPYPSLTGKPHAGSCRIIRRIVDEVYHGSQATLADATGCNFTQISHLVAGRRAVAMQHVAAIVRVLPREHADLAVALMAAWLQELADSVQEGFAVTVEAAA